MNKPLQIHLEALSKRYSMGEKEVIALDQVTLKVDPGTVVAITGPSGSGKSTLLHLIGAMDVADSGTIRVGDNNITTLSRSAQASYRRQIGFVFQRFHLLPALTALDNVSAPLLPYKTDFDKFEKARSLLAAVGLEERGDSLPTHLSGGQQQRVAIARALVNSPGLLLADEPTGNLDSKTGAEVMELLLELRGQHGMTVLVATHDQVIASRCDRIVRLKDGSVLDDIAVPRNLRSHDLLDRVTRLNASP